MSEPAPAAEIPREEAQAKLNEAIIKGDFEGVKKYIAARAEVNYFIPGEKFPLCLACEQGDIQIIEYLIESCSAWINHQEETKRYTALGCAVAAKKHKVVEYLLSKGHFGVATSCMRDENGLTGLMVAALAGDYDTIDVMCTYLDPAVLNEYTNTDDRPRSTALEMAIQQGHVNIVRRLIKAKANPYGTTQLGGPQEAARRIKEGREIFDILLKESTIFFKDKGQQQLNVDIHDSKGRTALMIAAQCGNLDMINYLIDNKANIEAVDGNKATALKHAYDWCQEKAVSLLKEKGAVDSGYVLQPEGQAKKLQDDAEKALKEARDNQTRACQGCSLM
jgi:ankyrin repeat protein